MRAKKNRLRIPTSPNAVAAATVMGILVCGVIANLAFDVLQTRLSPAARARWGEFDEWVPLLAIALPVFFLVRRLVAHVRSTEQARRASALTRQLLTFSRRQPLAPKVLDLNAVVVDLEKMLRRVIGENIELKVAPGADLGRVKADPGQVEQVIVNLVVNARDAMPNGGRIIIETGNVELDEASVDAAAGPHVMIAVSDNGCGMDAGVKSHLFEPFFTTKEKGVGTGLGLATSHGIVRRSGGHISVYSEPGHGSTFKVYLPRVDETAAAVEPSPAAKAPQGRETILFVEDDAMAHAFVAGVLAEGGYDVLAARNPEEAIRISAARREPIPLLLTDVVMPQMLGDVLAARLSETRSEMKTIFMSGFTEQSLVDPAELKGAFLQKPLSRNLLLCRVRDVLDGRAG